VDAGLVSGYKGKADVSNGFAGYPITARLGAELRGLNEAVRSPGAGAPQGRPEGGAVSHVAAMLQKMRFASNEEHARAERQNPSQSDFEVWHDQVDRARMAMMANRDAEMHASPASAEPGHDILPAMSLGSDDLKANQNLSSSLKLVAFPTKITVGYPMRKDIVLDDLDRHGDVAEMLGRQVIVNIQGVSFTCRVSQEVMDAVRSGHRLTSIMGSALQTAIRKYSLVANGDVVDAAFDGSVLNVRYVGDAIKPLLVSAFSEACPAADVWSTQIDIPGGQGHALRVVAAPIDHVVAAFSRSCLTFNQRSFINDNAFHWGADEPEDASEVLEYSAAMTEGDKRSIIEQAAMAMIRNARRTQTPEQ
jgi:hypothetical protein